MVKTALRLLFTTGAATAAAVVLAAGPASAHFCFKTELNERAQAKEGSPAWVTFGELAFEFTGLCPEGIEVLADAGGVEVDTLINSRGTMAGGTLKKGEDSGTPAISHLDFEAIDAAFPDAVAACEA